MLARDLIRPRACEHASRRGNESASLRACKRSLANPRFHVPASFRACKPASLRTCNRMNVQVQGLQEKHKMHGKNMWTIKNITMLPFSAMNPSLKNEREDSLPGYNACTSLTSTVHDSLSVCDWRSYGNGQQWTNKNSRTRLSSRQVQSSSRLMFVVICQAWKVNSFKSHASAFGGSTIQR